MKPICKTPTFRDFNWGFHRIFYHAVSVFSSFPSCHLFLSDFQCSAKTGLHCCITEVCLPDALLFHILTHWTLSPMFSSSYLGGKVTVLSLGSPPGSWLLLSFGTFLYFSSLLLFLWSYCCSPSTLIDIIIFEIFFQYGTLTVTALNIFKNLMRGTKSRKHFSNIFLEIQFFSVKKRVGA